MTAFNFEMAQFFSDRVKEQDERFKPKAGTFVEDAVTSLLKGVNENTVTDYTEVLYENLTVKAQGVSDGQGGFANDTMYPAITGEYVDQVVLKLTPLFDFTRNVALGEINKIYTEILEEFKALQSQTTNGAVYQAVKLDIRPEVDLSTYEDASVMNREIEQIDLDYPVVLSLDKLKDPIGGIATEYFKGDNDKLSRVRKALLKHDSGTGKISLEERQEVIQFYSDMYDNPGVKTGLGYNENQHVAAKGFNLHKADQNEHIESIRERREQGYLTEEQPVVKMVEPISSRDVPPVLVVSESAINAFASKMNAPIEDINSYISCLADRGDLKSDPLMTDVSLDEFRAAVESWENNSNIYSLENEENVDRCIRSLVIDKFKELYGASAFKDHEDFEFKYVYDILQSYCKKGSHTYEEKIEYLVQRIVARIIYPEVEGLYEVILYIRNAINVVGATPLEAFASAVVLVVNNFIISQITTVSVYEEN